MILIKEEKDIIKFFGKPNQFSEYSTYIQQQLNNFEFPSENTLWVVREALKRIDERVNMNTVLHNKLCWLSSEQLEELHITLLVSSEDNLKQLKQDLQSICGLDPIQEYNRILVNELYNFFTGENLEYMNDTNTLEPIKEKTDYMKAIREACSR